MTTHFNLWAVDPDGTEVLMTHDHKLARALGGKNALENTQTMCSPCNGNKAVAESKEDLRRHKEKRNAT